jgi:hypothetical protein
MVFKRWKRAYDGFSIAMQTIPIVMRVDDGEEADM